MANKEQLDLLTQNVSVWNRLRLEYGDWVPDLSGANLSEANLSSAILALAKLEGAHLEGAQLKYAQLGLANLANANLKDANLTNANLTNANLIGANLSHAKLGNANFSRADLSQANFSRADLGEAKLHEALLHEANWTETRCLRTTFGDVDLSQVKGLETAIHDGPSYIDIQTIYRSGGNIPEVFLRGAGVPDNFITFMKSLTGQAFDFYSCFISHSSKDREFVERLYADLQSNGVRCWYAPEDLKIGEPFLLGIDQGIRLHDKLLLVLSENSVSSGWVQHEVLSAMAKENGKAPWVLFPIRLDDVVMETDVHWANMIRESRHIGDFTRWKDHDSYKKAFDKLLNDLKGKS